MKQPLVKAAAKPARGRAAAPSQRQLRVAEEIRHLLAGVFGRGELHDPELVEVAITVTEVRISPDLKHATAFVTRLGRADVGLKLPALHRAAPYLRGILARELRLRVAPSVSFQADTSIEYAMQVERMLRAPAVARDLAAAPAGVGAEPPPARVSAEPPPARVSAEPPPASVSAEPSS